jgi:hypothetical protein
LIGGLGCKKSFCCWERLPGDLLIICHSTLDLIKLLGLQRPAKCLQLPWLRTLKNTGL